METREETRGWEEEEERERQRKTHLSRWKSRDELLSSLVEEICDSPPVAMSESDSGDEVDFGALEWEEQEERGEREERGEGRLGLKTQPALARLRDEDPSASPPLYCLCWLFALWSAWSVCSFEFAVCYFSVSNRSPGVQHARALTCENF